MRLIFLLVFSTWLIIACQDTPGNNSQGNQRGPIQSPKLTILNLFEESESIDSLVILYFKDKLRFRYYTFYTTTDPGYLSLFRANLTVDTAGATSCVKDGTIYGYINGNMYTTLYFALSDSCRSLRLFKNGKMYNYPLDAPFRLALKKLKTESKEP